MIIAERYDNLTCVYCLCEDTPDNPFTDEHIVGRRFVPKGSFAGEPTLIMRACSKCNKEKAQLENDISAITLLPALGERHTDPEIHRIAVRKAHGAYIRPPLPTADVERPRIAES